MTTSGLQDNARLLLNFNAVAENEVVPTLKMLGDITGGDKQRMDSLTLAFAQSASAGRLMGQDLLQMINAGFNPLQVMADKTGKSIGVLKDEMSKGKITTEMVVQAFKDATAEGGKFYGLMNDQSQSKAGLESTKKDNLEILSRTISDRAMPALKELDRKEIELIQTTTAVVEKINEWADVNNETLNAVTNTGLALGTAVLGYQSLHGIVSLVSDAHLKAVTAVNAQKEAEVALTYAKKVLMAEEVALYQATLAYNAALETGNAQAIKAAANDLAQAKTSYTVATAEVAKATATAKSTQATVLQCVATGNLTQALKLAIVQVRALTVSMLANPFTLVATAIAGLTAAFFALKNNAESTHKALEDLNNQQDQNVNKTNDAIKTLKELDGAQNLSYEQTKKLDGAIAYLTDKYPKYVDKLREELRLKGEISKATAEQIANEMTLARVKGLQEQRVKLNKDMIRDMKISNVVTFGISNKAGGRYGVRKANQLRDDELLKAEKSLEKERQAIINDLTGQSTSTPKTASKASSGTSSSSGSKKKNNDAEKARKEAVALRLAQLDAELLAVKGNIEQEYKIEQEKIDFRLAQEKRGTAAYQQILNERFKLEQQYQQNVAELELTALKNSNRINELNLEKEKALLETRKNNGVISDKEYFETLSKIENDKYDLKVLELDKEQELYKDNLAKFAEIEQRKSELSINHDIERQKIETDSAKAEFENWQKVFSSIGDSFKNNLSNLLQGNAKLKDSFTGLFSDIASAFAQMVAKMALDALKLKAIEGIKNLSGKAGWIGTAATAIRSWFHFADGGVVPGSYTQPTPIVAHGSEMVLNPFQQKNLWDMITGNQTPQNTFQALGGENNSGPVTINNFTPVFQSLDPAQGQKMFNDWMSQNGIPMVRNSIKNNNHQMRDVIKNV